MKEKQQQNTELKELPIEISQAIAYTSNFLYNSTAIIMQKINKEIEQTKEQIKHEGNKLSQKSGNLTEILKKLEHYKGERFLKKHLRRINSILNNLKKITSLEDKFQLVLVDSIYEYTTDCDERIEYLKKTYHPLYQAKTIENEKEILLFYKGLNNILLPKVSHVYSNYIEKLFTLIKTESDILKIYLDPDISQKVITFYLKVQIKLLDLNQQLNLLPNSPEQIQTDFILEEIQEIEKQNTERLIGFWNFFIKQTTQDNIITKGKGDNTINTVIVEVLDMSTMQNLVIMYMHDWYRIASKVNQLSKKVQAHCKLLQSSSSKENEIEFKIGASPSLTEEIISEDGIEEMLSEDLDEAENPGYNKYQKQLLTASPIIDSFPNDLLIDILLPELSTKKKNLFKRILNGEKLSLQSLNQVAGLPFVENIDPGREGSRMKVSCFDGSSINFHVPHGNKRGNSSNDITLSAQNQQTIQKAAISFIESKKTEEDIKCISYGKSKINHSGR